MKEVEFSFIVPIYNTEIKYLEECIVSILNEKISSYEIILVNDGTENENLNINYEKYAQTKENIRYFYQKNSGSAVARNLGLEKSLGKYIIFVDSDDGLKEGVYKEIKDVVNNKEFDIYCFDYSIWNVDNENLFSLKESKDLSDEKNDILSNIMYVPQKYDNYAFGAIWGKCFLKEFLIKNNIKFIPQLRKAQDRRFMLECVNSATKILYCPIYMYKYRKNNDSICKRMNYKMIEYYCSFQKEMNEYCEKNDINKECNKYLTYYIINELLLLTIFHIDNNKNFKTIKKEYYEIIEKFDFLKNIKLLNYNDFKGIKEKTKFFLFKKNLIALLKIYFILIQKKNNKTNFR